MSILELDVVVSVSGAPASAHPGPRKSFWIRSSIPIILDSEMARSTIDGAQVFIAKLDESTIEFDELTTQSGEGNFQSPESRLPVAGQTRWMTADVTMAYAKIIGNGSTSQDDQQA